MLCKITHLRFIGKIYFADTRKMFILQPMRFLALALLLTSCTTIYEGGKPVLRISSNARDVHFRTPAGTVFNAAIIDNSSIHRAIGNEIGKGILSLGSAVSTAKLVP